MRNLSSFFASGGVNLDEIKGLGWGSADNLHELAKGMRGLLPGVIRDHISSAGWLIHNDLTILDGTLYSTGAKLVVLGDLIIKSARLQASELVVFGNLTVEREPWDDSYTNLLTVNNLRVHGNVSLKNTTWGGFNTKVRGNFTADNTFSSGRTLDVGGDLTWNQLATIAINGVGTSGGNAGTFKIRAGGNLNLPALAQIDAWGADGYHFIGCNGGNGGTVDISAFGNLVLASTLQIDAKGGNSNGGKTGNGGNVKINHVGTRSTGTITANVLAGATGSTLGTNGTYALTQNTTAVGHNPGRPTPSTANGAVTSILTWAVPVDPNGSQLQFRMEIFEISRPDTPIKVVDETSVSNHGAFSGSKPYTSGFGTVTYTIGAQCVPGKRYRWYVEAFKDADSTNIGLTSPWREFIMA